MLFTLKISVPMGATVLRPAPTTDSVSAPNGWRPHPSVFKRFSHRHPHHRECQVARSRAPLQPSRSAPRRPSARPEPALPAERTRTRTNPAKSCSRGNGSFRRIPAPASALRAARTSRLAGPVPLAVSPSPRAPSMARRLPHLAFQSYFTHRGIFNLNRGFTSHIWDFSKNGRRHRALPFLYARSEEIRK